MEALKKERSLPPCGISWQLEETVSAYFNSKETADLLAIIKYLIDTGIPVYLRGSTILPHIGIIRADQRYTMCQLDEAAVGFSDQLGDRNLLRVVPEISEGRKIAHDAILGDLDLSVGAKLDSFAHTFLNLAPNLQIQEATATTCPSLKLVRLSGKRGEATFMKEGNPLSFRTPPCLGIDLLAAKITRDQSGNLVAIIDSQDIHELLGNPYSLRIVGDLWEERPEKIDAVIARGLRHAYTLSVSGKNGKFYHLDMNQDEPNYHKVKDWVRQLIVKIKKGQSFPPGVTKDLVIATAGSFASQLSF